MYADNGEDTSIDVESGEKIPDIVELAFLTTFQLDGRRKMVWKAERRVCIPARSWHLSIVPEFPVG